MTFKTVKAAFNEKYPQGTIYKENTYNMINVFKVCYTSNNKVYTYRVHNLNALMIKLGLKEKPSPIIEEPINIEEFNKNIFGIKL